ncbi:unnamed protein product [Jaminaea pallidilutea]
MPAAARSARRIQSVAGAKLLARGHTTDSLLKKLKGIQAELSSIDEEVDFNSLTELNGQLCSTQLTLHKDRAVRASVACCLADVLRITAPNAPFTLDQLKDIFQFFLLELTAPKAGLSNSTSPQYQDYYRLLENLSRVKTLALVAELNSPEDLMIDWFRRVFDIVNPSMSKNVEICLADILAQLVDEIPQVPGEVIEMLMASFSATAHKMNPSAHQLTVQICQATNERLQPMVSQYFSENIITASSEEEPAEKEKELRTFHGLIAQISRFAPSLLLNVIAVLEQELLAEDVIVRQIAVRTLGQMLADKNGYPLATKYPNVWKAWLLRSNDKQVNLRIVWAEMTGPLISAQPQLCRDLVPYVQAKVQDPDERVRAAVAKVIGGLDFETALHHIDRNLLVSLAERLRDRKVAVRHEAQEGLGRLFSLAYPEIENHDPAATKQFAWIPNAMMTSAYSESASLCPLIAACEKYILPLPSRAEDEGTWVNRLLMVMKHLDERGTKALFLKLNNMAARHARKPYLPFIKACEDFNGGSPEGEEAQRVKDTLKAAIRGVVSNMPDRERASHDLSTFAKMNDSRIYRLIKLCLDPVTDLKTYIKARAEAIRRVEAADEKLVATITNLIRLASYPFANGNTVPTLLKRLTHNKAQWRESQVGSMSVDSDGATQSQTVRELAPMSDMAAFKIAAVRVMTFMSKSAPEMFLPHRSALLQSLNEEDSQELLEASLKALCAVKASAYELSPERRSFDRMSKCVRQGSRLQAKYAARLLALLAGDSSAERRIVELLGDLSKRLSKDDPTQLVADLSALGQFFKHASKLAQQVWDDVVRDVLRDLSKPWPAKAAESFDDDEDWVEDDAMNDATRAKILGLDVLCKRALATPEDVSSSADMTTPVFRLLWRTIEAGEPRELETPAPVKSRLRLQAALCVLKLAVVPECDKKIDRDFSNLALMVQDACFNVRSAFLHKLLLYLSTGAANKAHRLGTRYNAIPFMAAIDPEEENREMVMLWAQRQMTLPKEERLRKLELTLCRYVHLLSHHPDFSRASDESIREFVPYVQFYLDCIATEANVGLLFHLAGRLKTVRDGTSQGASENLYTLSEMTQLIIKHKAARHNWRLDQYPGQFKVPSDTGLKALPSPQAQKEVYETVWLPSSVVESLEREVAKAEKKSRQMQQQTAANQKTGAINGTKRPAVGKATGETKRVKRDAKFKVTKRRRADDDDDEVDGDDDDDSDEDGSADENARGQEKAISSDEDVSDGEVEGRGARAKQAARARNADRAKRRSTLSEKKTNHSKARGDSASRPKPTARATAKAAGGAGGDEDNSMSELSDVE